MSKKKRNDILIVIPARLDSSRLPSKLLEDLHGFPLLYWIAKRVGESDLADFVVATDHNKIFDVCQTYNFPVIMTSSNCKNGTERVYEIAKEKKENYDFFINVQGDEPLLNLEIVETLIDSIGENDDSFKTAISQIGDTSSNNSSEIKVALSHGGRIIYASRAGVPFSRDGKSQHFKIHGVYLYTFDILERFINSPIGPLEDSEKVEQLRCIENNIPIYGIPTPHTPISVDTMRDLEFYRRLDLKMFAFE